MSEIIEKLEQAKENLKEFDLDNSCNNLYHICLQYFATLQKVKHPKIQLITDIMDQLIALKKNMKDNTYKENVSTYDKIHGICFSNIQSIYDYDKENQTYIKKEEDEEIKEENI